MFKNIFPVILCGGSGTRLWPLSRTSMPKQFIHLKSSALFEDTLERVQEITDKSIIICNNEHRFLAASMMLSKGLDLRKNVIFLEPVARNTALPIALAALYAMQKNADAYLLVMPSDHVLKPISYFIETLKNILPYAQQGITTFGITPNSPHTGYGYIEKGNAQGEGLFCVDHFVEKPNLANAEKLLERQALWNSGMFFMPAKIYLEELQKYREDIYTSAKNIWNSRYTDLDFTRFDADAFADAPAESIDYAVMEKTTKALVCPLRINWSDLGSFASLHEAGEKDANNNANIGNVLAHNTKNSYIHATSALVSVVGMDNVAVVQTKDAVLVSPLQDAKNLKEMLAILKRDGHVEAEQHCIYHRPWGHYESLIDGTRFQVKHIVVNPDCILSRQKHHHRSEHWIVVKGTALVELGGPVETGGVEKVLAENESVYIPLGTIHRLSNPGKIPLELIEVQTGSYLGEDDIVRLADAYGREYTTENI